MISWSGSAMSETASPPSAAIRTFASREMRRNVTSVVPFVSQFPYFLDDLVYASLTLSPLTVQPPDHRYRFGTCPFRSNHRQCCFPDCYLHQQYACIGQQLTQIL